MRLKIELFIVLLIGLVCAQSDCPEKMGSADPPQDQFCALFANAPDTAFFIFSINFYRYPFNVENDSAHLALLAQHSEELFSKYDLRHESDTAVRWDGIPNGDLSYGYEGMLMTKKTALEIIQEPYVVNLSYQKVPQTVSALPAGRSAPVGIFPRRFDLMGREVSGSRPNRRGALFLARPD
jgi:hypothetical protein